MLREVEDLQRKLVEKEQEMGLEYFRKEVASYRRLYQSEQDLSAALGKVSFFELFSLNIEFQVLLGLCKVAFLKESIRLGDCLKSARLNMPLVYERRVPLTEVEEEIINEEMILGYLARKEVRTTVFRLDANGQGTVTATLKSGRTRICRILL